ncbi:DUF2637 domain-containing protein [Rhodococcus marinonascens]|uniref:DUF2637 domain-containing protein n=1 Tax=Rhodococcus marinonascens TaxID=38311 RepID=UPI000932354F|nr:DUF2637 domain-containing protein [Rhodococcus marinonascens]
MDDFNLRAARVQLGALIAALLLAILIALGITTGAFVLSFAVQRDLARQATIPEDLAWIFPVIVDSAIFGSTIAIVILTKLRMRWWDKGFYIALAVTVVVISILGNAYHAFHNALAAHTQLANGGVVGYMPLDPAIAAAIAVIPPALVLAFTHGLGILIKATGIAYSDYKRQIDTHSTGDEHPDAKTGHPDAKNVAQRKPALRGHVAFGGAAQHAPVEPGDGCAETPQGAHLPESGDNTDADTATAGTEVAEILDTRAEELTPAAIEPDPLAAVEQFITESNLPNPVKDTARRKLADPTLTWETLAQTSTPAVHTSTAWRRYEKFDTAARAAGFTEPPLFDLRASDIDYDDQLVTTS